MTQIDAAVSLDNSDEASHLLNIIGQLQNAGDNIQSNTDLLEEAGYTIDFKSTSDGSLLIVISEK